MLNDLRAWFDGRSAALAAIGLQAEFTESPPEHAKQSASVTIVSSRRIGQLVVWTTGEAELSLGDVGADEVVEEHREITSAVGLEDATLTLLAWLGVSRN